MTGPVNLGNPGKFADRQLAGKVPARMGSEPGLVFRQLPQDDPEQRRPDISLACGMLDREPETDLHTGLTKTITYFEDLRSKKA